MEKVSIWIMPLLFLGAFGAKVNDVRVSSRDANSFVRDVRSWFRSSLGHECYVEGCTFEEVAETISNKQRANEYYYTYTCTKFGKNCKVPCTYREKCTLGNWGSWRGDIKVDIPGCYQQTRTKPYNYPLQTKMMRISCGGLNIECNLPPVEKRMQCVCKKANCLPGYWEEWTGNIEEGSCGKETRMRPHILSWSMQQQTGSCNGIPASCPAPQMEVRKMCSCAKADCTLGGWGEWDSAVAEGTCSEQKRRRKYTKTIVYEEHVEKCPSLSQECPSSLEETRSMCSCKYATCSLGEWSEWEPKELKQGECGQQQTRTKTYSLTWTYQNHLVQCPSLPQECPDDLVERRTQCKCTYRESCELQAWSAWDKPLTEEGCQMQTRIRSYVHPLKYSLQEDCSGLLTSCLTEPKETRNYCKCKHVECTLDQWSDWSSAVLATGNCGKEKRTRRYIAKEKFSFRENCDGVATSCPAEQEETRTVCKCRYVTCNISEWNSWRGTLPADGCAQQIRTKNVTEEQHEKMQAENCEGLQTSCPSVQSETRQWCNCSFRENCVLKDWSDWSGHVPNGGCAVQLRTRKYNQSLEWIERETCDGLESCPAITEDTRTKCHCNQIICTWGNWTRISVNSETNCYQEIRVKNESSGFKVVQRLGSCDGIPIECSDAETEKQEDCISGGGGHVVHTSPPPATQPSSTTAAPTTGFKPATFVSLGCFADTGERPRPLPILIANMRGEIDWYNLKKTVQACAEEAKKKRLEYFSVQFFGECWSGANSGKTFARDGETDQCYKGVGMKNTNAVYRIEDLPACSSELQFKASVSTGEVTGNVWCAGNTAEYQWITVDFGGERKISGVGTQGGNKDSWVTLYTVEWSEDGKSWETYQEDRQEKIFSGNSDRFTLETRWLKHPITAGFLRFRPKSWTSTHVCMKIKIYGCPV